MNGLRLATLSFLLSLVGESALAVELTLTAGAKQLANRVSLLDSYELPVGPVQNGDLPVRHFEGRVQRETWRIDSGSITTLQLLKPLRDQIKQAGFELIFECEDRGCGGFDFRFGTEVVPTPDMYVDIQDFRFLSATDGDRRAIGVLVSRSRSAAYLQVIQTSSVENLTLPVSTQAPALEMSEDSGKKGKDLVAKLQREGHVVLDDLDFGTGADALGQGPYQSLRQLAEFLKDNPDLVVMFVGHTDSIGGLEENIALSKRRAEVVRERMLDLYEVPSAQVDAQGMGYLAPVASNLDANGRALNRRVEAVLLQRP